MPDYKPEGIVVAMPASIWRANQMAPYRVDCSDWLALRNCGGCCRRICNG